MKSVLSILCVLAISHHAFAATCLAIKQYSSTYQPTCIGDDIDTLWPNYENFSQYYRCQNTGKPVLVDCALNTFFCYTKQTCTTCANVIAAPDCEDLITANKTVCVSMTATEDPTTEATVSTVVPTMPPYNMTLQPACIGKDVNYLWPNYENISEYYMCLSDGTPVLANCAVNTYFTYYLQMCTTSDNFVPAPKCELLNTQNSPICVSIKPVPTTPTESPTPAPTDAPTTASTEAPSTVTPQTPPSDETNPPTSATDAPPTPPSSDGNDIPTPPSEPSSAPDIPTPPSPVPTPPTVPGTPPSQV